MPGKVFDVTRWLLSRHIGCTILALCSLIKWHCGVYSLSSSVQSRVLRSRVVQALHLTRTWHSVLFVPTQSRGSAEIALKSHAAVASPTAVQHPIIASLTMSSLFYSNLYVVNWPRNPFLLRVSQASLSRRVYALLYGYPYHNPAAICDSHV